MMTKVYVEYIRTVLYCEHALKPIQPADIHIKPFRNMKTVLYLWE